MTGRSWARPSGRTGSRHTPPTLACTASSRPPRGPRRRRLPCDRGHRHAGAGPRTWARRPALRARGLTAATMRRPTDVGGRPATPPNADRQAARPGRTARRPPGIQPGRGRSEPGPESCPGRLCARSLADRRSWKAGVPRSMRFPRHPQCLISPGWGRPVCGADCWARRDGTGGSQRLRAASRRRCGRGGGEKVSSSSSSGGRSMV